MKLDRSEIDFAKKEDNGNNPTAAAQFPFDKSGSCFTASSSFNSLWILIVDDEFYDKVKLLNVLTLLESYPRRFSQDKSIEQ